MTCPHQWKRVEMWVCVGCGGKIDSRYGPAPTHGFCEPTSPREGPILPGWTCPNRECGVFNGDVKERLTYCRSCGTLRPDTGHDSTRKDGLPVESSREAVNAAIRGTAYELTKSIHEDALERAKAAEEDAYDVLMREADGFARFLSAPKPDTSDEMNTWRPALFALRRRLYMAMKRFVEATEAADFHADGQKIAAGTTPAPPPMPLEPEPSS